MRKILYLAVGLIVLGLGGISSFSYAGEVYSESINHQFKEIGGFKFTTVDSDNPTITPDGSEVIYRNYNDGDKLYKKGIDESGTGTQFTPVGSENPTITPDGSEVIYINKTDGNKLYKINLEDPK